MLSGRKATLETSLDETVRRLTERAQTALTVGNWVLLQESNLSYQNRDL